MIRPFLPKNGRRFIAEFIVVFMLALIAGTGLAVEGEKRFTSPPIGSRTSRFKSSDVFQLNATDIPDDSVTVAADA